MEWFWLSCALVLAVLGWGLYRWLAPVRGPSPYPEIPTYLLEAGDWTFRYHQSGRGPHLVLLHGIGANLFCWRWILPFLRARFTVTILDLPGFGGSSKPVNAGYGLDEQAERLALFFKRIGIDKMYLAGNSMGGNIGLWYALTYPDQVTSLALIAPAASPALVRLPLSKFVWLSAPVSLLLTRPAMKWAHRRTVSKKNLVDKDRVEETFRTYGRRADAVRSFLMATETIRDRRLVERAADLAPPVLLLWGSRDRLVSRKVIDALESALRAVDSHVHIGGGHHLQEDEPEWVSEKLTSFFLP